MSSTQWATEWAQDSITALYSATTQSAFDLAFNKFLLSDATVAVNGASLTLAQYKQYLEGERALAVAGSVKFLEVVGVPLGTVGDAASVGVFYEATVAKTTTRGPENTVKSSLNLSVEKGPIIPPGGGPGPVQTIHATAVNQIVVEQPNPVVG